ncbi:Holliday junction DNA helicase [Thermocladium modestius]|uniref:Crossover junction endodeoxyribonuclease Hjc n=1 Tax=Thermocladium modestius TaxID=62609 RepID=A0A830GUY8_9CREN|nr:Holliday junction resolvase Hjc [Thermocladium modestius]GGP20764.1 Holliday junction DNA helicase [Thermocladium modestius]
MSHKAKGSSYERKIANYLWEEGFAVLRGCSSGGGVRRRYVPDIVATINGKTLVIEVKYRAREGTIYIEGDKYARLLEFARRASGAAYVAVKYGSDKWRVIPAEKLERTGEGNMAVRPSAVAELGMPLEALVASLKNEPLTEFMG